MPGNSDPIFSRKGAISMRTTAALGVASNRTSTYDGTNSTTDKIIFTADATNGSFVQRIRFKALGANALAAVARIYINNGATQATATNNAFYGELSLPTTTASTTAATVDIDYPLNFALPPGYTILCGVSSSADIATGWVTTVIAGDY